MERFRQEWNTPSRSDYYLMQLTAAVLRMKKRSLDRLKVPFKFKDDHQGSSMTAETATDLAKARWKTRLGATRDGG